MQQQIGVVSFLSVLLVITLSNLFFFKKLKSQKKPSNPPRVSILIPARNEESNVGACLETLLRSDYPNFEIVVLNDHSEDGTEKVVEAISKRDGRVTLIKGKPIPPGWLGKHWACHQLFQAATGEYILFTDADTRHAPDNLTDAVSGMRSAGIDFLTLFPREKVVTWAEKLTLPIMSFSFLAIIPLGLAYYTRLPGLSSANGQFMMFRKRAYEIMGGHEAIKNKVLDDFSLAERTRQFGFKWRFLDGSNRIECRMYNNLREVYAGLGKNLFSVFGCHTAIYVFIWLWMGYVFIGTPIVGALSFSDVLSYEKLAWLCVASTVLGFILWTISLVRFKFPVYLNVLYPMIIAMSMGLAFTSLVLTVSGNSKWKGRTLIRPKIHWI